ncbi:MAG: hypothetical protein DMG13_32120 [Acidobacteria bacterium]|nr:MAG: hypothetical protein DMG13_32120 [Acidobacteriota bacterium]
MHHRKEGWPSDQKIIAKPPLTARPGWFSDENKWKTTPAASVSVAARNFLDEAATPPCGRARRGITLDSNLFTAPMTAQPQKHGAEGIPLLTDVPGGALPNASPDPKFATVGAVYDRP